MMIFDIELINEFHSIMFSFLDVQYISPTPCPFMCVKSEILLMLLFSLYNSLWSAGRVVYCFVMLCLPL